MTSTLSSGEEVGAGAGPVGAPERSAAGAEGVVPADLPGLARQGALRLALPGSGSTWSRWCRLAAWSEADLSVGRLVEGHTDAAAILDELGSTVPLGLLGVWAAGGGPDPLIATEEGAGGWRLRGVKRWCSGATLIDAALVTAESDTGPRLFLVERGAGFEPLPGTWPALGMAGSDSGDVSFDVRVPPEAALGRPGRYVARPGFWHGSAGVAACWFGGARGVANVLRHQQRSQPDGHALADLGAVEASLVSMEAVLRRAAAEIDADPEDRGGNGERRARTVRAVVEEGVSAVLDRVGRATGAGPLCHDAGHARRVADLAVYVRQSHAEADLARLGELVLEREQP